MVGMLGFFGKKNGEISFDQVLKDLCYTGDEVLDTYHDEQLKIGLAQHPTFFEEQPVDLEDDLKLWVWGTSFGYFQSDSYVNRAQISGDSSGLDCFKQAYDRYGSDFIQHVNGDYCGVLYDNSQNKIQLFTNRLASRPIFYLSTDRAIYFSSSIQPLISINDEEVTLSDDFLAEYLILRRVLGEKTPIDEISKVPPASSLTYDPTSGVNISNYWMPKYAYSEQSKDELCERFLDILTDNMNTLVGSYDKLGVLLSGGSDSRLIASLIDEPELYHMTYWKESTETQTAKKIARHLDTELTILETDEGYYERALEENPKMMDFMGLFTQGHASLFDQVYKDDVDVMITAQFMDTFFKGYVYPEKKLKCHIITTYRFRIIKVPLRLMKLWTY
ncbi:asparagine synthase-related protein [Halovenus salina]|uniref:Asparagine synthase-related protein n=1 Tax=Halovenus salina TaxID=1510225 RepID=A0ABD5W553_9EURY